MTQRLLIHAGFHKTATTTIQEFLKINAPQLGGDTHIVIRKPLDQELTRYSRRYCENRKPADLYAFCTDFAQLLTSLPKEHSDQIIISSENFAGRMPGRRASCTYAATVEIIEHMFELTQEYLPDYETRFLFTTRDKPAWLESLYWYLIAYGDITEDLAEFTNRIDRAVDLDAIINELKQRIGGEHILHADIGDYAGAPYGPATPILDWLYEGADLPKLIAAPNKNTRLPEALLLELRAINRSQLSSQEKTDKKREIRQSYRPKSGKP